MESWTLSLLLFVLILYYCYLVARNLQQHESGAWDSSRLFLYLGLPFILMVMHFIIYGKNAIPFSSYGSFVGVLESLALPLMQWTFWFPLLIAVVLLTYAQLTGSNGKVNVNFDIFDPKSVKNLLDGDKSTSVTKDTLLALFNILIVVVAFLVLLLASTLMVTILRFQRNNLGLLTHVLLYLPCILSERIAAWVGETSSLLPQDLRNQGPMHKTAFVVGVLLLCSMYGFGQLLNTQRTFRAVQEKAASLLNIDPKNLDADRAVQWYIVPPRKDVRLHVPSQVSLSAIILEQHASQESASMAAVLNQLKNVWSIRFRLFLNSQQQGSFFERRDALAEQSRHVFSFGETMDASANYVELRACQTGVFLRSQFFDAPLNNLTTPMSEFAGKIVPLSFQSWHDVVIQHTGRKMDFAIDGQLVQSVDTATSNSPRIPVLSPELTFFFLGEKAFNGVLTNMHIAFNSAIESTHFDHDPLLHRT